MSHWKHESLLLPPDNLIHYFEDEDISRDTHMGHFYSNSPYFNDKKTHMKS